MAFKHFFIALLLLDAAHVKHISCFVAIVDCTHGGLATAFFGLGNPADILVEGQIR